MGTKNNPGVYDCYGNLEPDEPYFTLRAKDAMAPSLIRSWAQMREHQVQAGIKPPEDMAAVKEARDCATAMEMWRADKINAAMQTNKPAPLDTSSAPEPAAASSEPTPAEPRP